MRNSKRTALVGFAAATLSLGVISPGVAGTSTTYHGYYDGVTTYTPLTPGDTACPSEQHLAVSGVWNVRIAGDRATMSTNLFYGGEHHLAYGGGFDVVTQGEDAFQISTDVGDGITVTLTLQPDGALSYVVAPYPLYEYDCASLTLTGHEGRPATSSRSPAGRPTREPGRGLLDLRGEREQQVVLPRSPGEHHAHRKPGSGHVQR